MPYNNKDSELFVLWASYSNEIVEIQQFASEEKSNDANRAIVRAFFSMVEGVSFRIRQILLERYEEGVIQLTPEQFIALSEIEVQIEPNGNLINKKKFGRFENLFNFTFKLYSKLYDKSSVFESLKAQNSYDDFKKSIKIRNRITHPKNSSDVFVDGEDYKKIKSARDWFHRVMIALLKDDVLERIKE